MDEALQKWTDEHTGGLLSEYISDIKTDPEAVMELISAIYFKATWIDKFNKDDNTTETFHGLNGDTECDMMHMSGSDIYFWGDRFTAALMGIAEGYSMYFILPDEGEELSDVISDPQVFELIKYGNSMEYENNKYLKLPIPKMGIVL